MADFNINIRTLADLTGIQLTQQQLDALQRAAAAGNKDAIAALKKLSAAQKEAATVAREAQQEFNYGIRAAGAYGLLIGGVVAKAINDFATAQNKVTKELDEQGRALVKNVQEWNKLAQASTSMEQLASVGEKASGQIEQLTNKFNEANSEVLTLGQSVQDLIEKFVTWTPFQPGSNQALLDERIKGLMTNLAEAQQNAARVVKRGLDEQRDIHLDIDSVIKRETDHLHEQEELLKNLDPKTQLQSWVAVEQTIERIKKKLAELSAIEAARNKTIEEKTKSVQQAGAKASESEKKAAALQGKPGGEEAAQQAAQDRAEAQRQEAELREQKRAAARKESDFAEVKKYGRVLDPQERAQETIKEREELGQKAGEAQEKERQKALEDQMQQQLRGITPEQQRNEREALGVKPPAEKDTSQGIIRAIDKLNEKFDRYWQ